MEEQTQLEFLESQLEEARRQLWLALKDSASAESYVEYAMRIQYQQICAVRVSACSQAVSAIVSLIEREEKEK